MQLQQLLLTTPLFFSIVKAYSPLGCYSSLPSSYSSVYEDIYQSSFKCSQHCSGYSYFALMSGNGCYCGNEAPSGDTSSGCTISCFGFDQETCGGASAYNFYALSNDVTGGTTGTSGTSGTTVASTGTTTTQQTTGTATSQKNTGTTNTNSNTNSNSNTNTQTTTTGDTTGTTAGQTIKVTTESMSGTTVVIYSTIDWKPSAVTSVIATATQSASASSSGTPNKKSSTNLIGPVVGGVIGGIVLIILLVILTIFLRRRRGSSEESNGDDELIDEALSDSAYQAALKRDKSTSRPLSNPFLSKEEVMIDQRLNPVMLGRRRISEGSLADEADYSRKILRVANPDDEL